MRTFDFKSSKFNEVTTWELRRRYALIATIYSRLYHLVYSLTCLKGQGRVCGANHIFAIAGEGDGGMSVPGSERLYGFQPSVAGSQSWTHLQLSIGGNLNSRSNCQIYEDKFYYVKVTSLSSGSSNGSHRPKALVSTHKHGKWQWPFEFRCWKISTFFELDFEEKYVVGVLS